MSPRALRLTRLVLAAAIGVLVLFLALLDKPWSLPGGPGFAAERGESLFITAKIALWWAALLNVFGFALALATLRLWAAPLAGAPAAAPRRPGPGVALALLAAMLLAGLVRFELAHSSLFWDEVWTLQRAVMGRVVVPEGGGPQVFEPVPWRKTLWTFKKPTNHVLQSIASRMSLGAWQRLGGHTPSEFDEFAYRLPSFLAALLSVALVGWLLVAWGWPHAGAAAAFLLALHPWHVEYGPAARGYGFVVLFGASLALCLTRALRSGRFAWCAGVAVSLVLLFWSHAFAFYLALALGLAAIPALALAPFTPADRLRVGARLAVSALFAAMFLLQVMAPNFAQVPLWEHVHDSEGAVVSARALREAFGLSTLGIPLQIPASVPELPFPSLLATLEAGGVAALAIRFLVPALLALGWLALLRERGPARFVATGLLAAVPLAALGASLQGHSFYARFLIFGVLAAVPLLAVGVEAGLRAVPWPTRARHLAIPLGLALAVLGFHALVAPQLALLRAQPYSGMRDVVDRLGEHPDAVKAGLGLGGDNAKVYDPGLDYFETADELAALCREARSSDAPLYVYYGYTRQNRARRPDAFEVLDDRSQFTPAGFFGAVQPAFCYRLLRYSGEDCAFASPASATTSR